MGENASAKDLSGMGGAGAPPLRSDARAPQRRLVASFASTFDALEAERLCRAASVPGRIIPLPAQIRADCGLAWVLPAEDAARQAFLAALAGRVQPVALTELAL